jgi:hypothetical protein
MILVTKPAPPKENWNDGIVEYWNNGFTFHFIEKIGFSTNIPLFQHSDLPVGF